MDAIRVTISETQKLRLNLQKTLRKQPSWELGPVTLESLHQGLKNHNPWFKSSLLPVFVNKRRVFTYILPMAALGLPQQRRGVATEVVWWKPKMFTAWPFMGKVCQCHLNSSTVSHINPTLVLILWGMETLCFLLPRNEASFPLDVISCICFCGHPEGSYYAFLQEKSLLESW